jgi:CO dehydrogenase/acetyl-CoA synthase alpha subunit
MGYDINKILAEYGEQDFGFSAVDEAEYEAVIAEKDETVEEYKTRLEHVEKIIIPFLSNLYKTREQAYIHWPNRGPVLEQQMQKILKLTRG